MRIGGTDPSLVFLVFGDECGVGGVAQHGGRLTAFTLRSAAAAAWVRRSSAVCGGCRGPLPLLSMVDGGARVWPPVRVDDLEQIPPISRDQLQVTVLEI